MDKVTMLEQICKLIFQTESNAFFLKIYKATITEESTLDNSNKEVDV